MTGKNLTKNELLENLFGKFFQIAKVIESFVLSSSIASSFS
jgi:hypothetical protein